jgi:hypothetical protein
MQLHAYMRTAGLLLACALCTLLLALAFGGQGHSGATRIPGRTYGSACSHSSAVCFAARDGARQVASSKRQRAESGAVRSLCCLY